jgi:hypothetical protein
VKQPPCDDISFDDGVAPNPTLSLQQVWPFESIEENAIAKSLDQIMSQGSARRNSPAPEDNSNSTVAATWRRKRCCAGVGFFFLR